MINVYIKLNIVTGITKTSQMVNLFNTMIIIVLLKMVTYFQVVFNKYGSNNFNLHLKNDVILNRKMTEVWFF